MRILTHNDFDGAVSAMLISCMEEIEAIRFTTPEKIQRREIRVSKQDIIADLPFHPNCGMWFDHHLSNETKQKFEGRFELAPSAARVVYNYYDNPYLVRYKELLEATDKIDSGVVTLEDIRKPSGYYLLSITLDLDKEKSDPRYRKKLIDWLKSYKAGQILEFPEVKVRVESIAKEHQRFKQEAPTYTRLVKNVAILDLRNVATPPKGGNFLLYTLYPQCNVSIRVYGENDRDDVKISVGHNVFNKTCKVNIGELLKKFGGGGHFPVGGCTVEKKVADEKIKEIVEALVEK